MSDDLDKTPDGDPADGAVTDEATTDETTTGDVAEGQEAGASAGGRSVLPKVFAGVAAVLVVALAVLVGILGKGYLDDRAAEQARGDAVAAATAQAAAMLSYDYNDVDQQLAAAADGLTGDFRDEYNKLVQDTIAPGAKEKKLTVQATVQAGSVVTATPDDAVVLLFVNQVTTSADVPDAATTGSRVRMEMHRDGDRWLTGRLTPV